MKLNTNLPIWFTWAIAFIYNWEYFSSIWIDEPLEKKTKVYNLLLAILERQKEIEWLKELFELVNWSLTTKQICEVLKDFKPLTKEEYELFINKEKQSNR